MSPLMICFLIGSFRFPRDPNSIETLQSFGKAVDWAKSGKFTQQDIDEAKLSVFSAVDSPVAPSDKGILGSGNRIPYRVLSHLSLCSHE